jgi:hypothetical protein
VKVWLVVQFGADIDNRVYGVFNNPLSARDVAHAEWGPPALEEFGVITWGSKYEPYAQIIPLTVNERVDILL